MTGTASSRPSCALRSALPCGRINRRFCSAGSAAARSHEVFRPTRSNRRWTHLANGVSRWSTPTGDCWVSSAARLPAPGSARTAGSRPAGGARIASDGRPVTSGLPNDKGAGPSCVFHGRDPSVHHCVCVGSPRGRRYRRADASSRFHRPPSGRLRPLGRSPGGIRDRRPTPPFLSVR
jgi:hypothetical protein